MNALWHSPGMNARVAFAAYRGVERSGIGIPSYRREDILNVIPFLKYVVALQVFVKCNLIRHKLTVCATKKRYFQLEMV